jgi:hypothetical protein
MTILDEIQASIRQHAQGADSSVVGIGQRRGVGGVDLFDALHGAQAASSTSASCAAPASGPCRWCSPQKPRAT